jgi:hypothetical protein
MLTNQKAKRTEGSLAGFISLGFFLTVLVILALLSAADTPTAMVESGNLQYSRTISSLSVTDSSAEQTMHGRGQVADPPQIGVIRQIG